MIIRPPKVPWTTRLGTIGQKVIQSRLAYFSNPSEYEQDTGLDFYCELLENDSPSSPFYVQAKGTEHFDSNWGCSLPKSTIIYWLQQQSPVFLIVYDENNKTCYWMSIEDNRYDLIQKIFTTKSNTIYIKVDKSNILEQDKNKNIAFISKIEEDSNSVKLFRGSPQFIGRGYLKRVPSPPRSKQELKQIKENVRAGLYSLMQHYDATGDIKTIQTFCEFLVTFDKSHFNHFAWLGHIYIGLGQNQLAKEMFEEALRICKADKDWPGKEMQKIIESLEVQIRNLKSNT